MLAVLGEFGTVDVPNFDDLGTITCGKDGSMLVNRQSPHVGGVRLHRS